MKNKKDLIEFILLGAIIVLLFVGLVFSAIHFKKQENQLLNESIEEDKQTEKEESGTLGAKEQENGSLEAETSSNQQTPSGSLSTGDSASSNSGVVESKEEESVSSEGEVVSYFETLDTSLMNYQDENNPTFREKAKTAFTTVVDFLFYGSTIHGYTFHELTTSTKLKILQIALKIDQKIDSYFPNYRDTIKQKMSNLKGKVALLYLEQTAKICENIGESACTEAREDFKNLKESFGFTWDIIKTAASSSYTSLKTILNEWYQSIKE